MLKEKFMEELKDAMRNKDGLKKNTISMLKAAVLQIEKDEQKTLNDDEIMVVVSKEVKKRKESIAEFEKAGREDIAEDLKKEIVVLSKYLPVQLSEEEIKKMVEEAIKVTGAASPRDMGKVMAELRPKTNGKADGKLVSDIVKSMLA